MNEVLGTCVNIHVLLLRKRSCRKRTRLVVPSSSISHSEKQTFNDHRQVQIENHRSNDVVSGNPVPSLIEVGEVTVKQLAQKCTSLALEVGIHEEEEEAGVEELADEHVLGDVGRLLRLSVTPDDLETPDHQLLDDNVDQNDELIAKVVRPEGCIRVFEKGLTNWR